MSRRAPSILILFLLLASHAQAKDATVFDVRRPLAMKNDEVLPKDYFINAGSNDGLRENMLVMVNRRQSLYDAYQNKSPGDLVVPVGQLRIIHVQGEISVARLEKLLSREELPGVDFEAIMVGDKVDLTSAKMGPRKTASLNENPMPIQLAPSVETTVPEATPKKAEEAPQSQVQAGAPM